jgi:hypothetical protein
MNPIQYVQTIESKNMFEVGQDKMENIHALQRGQQRHTDIWTTKSQEQRQVFSPFFQLIRIY